MSDNALVCCMVSQQLLQLAIEHNGSVAYCYGQDDGGHYVDICVDIPYRGDRHDTNYVSYRLRDKDSGASEVAYRHLIQVLAESPQNRATEIAEEAERKTRSLSGTEIVAKLGDRLEDTLEAMEQTADGEVIIPGMPTFRLRIIFVCVAGTLQTRWTVIPQGRTYVGYTNYGKDLYSTMEAAEEAGMKLGYSRLAKHEGVV